MPYIYSEFKDVNKNVVPNEYATQSGAELYIDEAVDGDLKEKVIKFASGEEVKYDKLILGLGSHPFVSPIPGRDLKNVFTVKKDENVLQDIYDALNRSTNIVIIGGGFIGAEIGEQFSNIPGKNVTIVEVPPHCLLLAMEEEFAVMAENRLKDAGINVLTNASAKAINGNGSVESVELTTGEKIPADMVLIAIGAAANVDLAKKLGLEVDMEMGIQVDKYM